jgi:hypothetical protein
MKDLANERDAIVRTLNGFNFEPVNAEGWLPSGASSWDRILRELHSSHLFVLIIGERYGTVPTEGPGAGQGISITEMEFNAACLAGMPILPFLKRLDYDSDRSSENARQRDAFRERVAKWDGGRFTEEFDLASDLSEKVAAAVVEILTESYLNVQIGKRSAFVAPVPREPVVRTSAALTLDPELLGLIRERKAIVLAGAGMSLQAGFPSARALTELLLAKIHEQSDVASPAAMGGSFQQVAENFSLAYGRDALVSAIQKGLSAPQGVEPTRAHRLAVNLFDVVLTTNFDTLFEAACTESKIDYSVISDNQEIPLRGGGGTTIVKLDGTLNHPNSLVLTMRDAMANQGNKPQLWNSLAQIMKSHPVIVIGSSLRDASANALLDLAGAGLQGYIVAPDLGSFDLKRFRSRGLKPIVAGGDDFMDAVAAGVNSARAR